MKKSRKLFFAIPFDSATINLYKKISKIIIKYYPDISVVIGNNEIGPSPKYSDIASFKLQNRELTKQFISQIQEADIVIADLTHNNPNVHVELGIALMENKNILRVTGRSVSELGFDIRNLEVFKYNNEKQLTVKILEYMKIFYNIKELDISIDNGALYFKEPSLLNLRGYDPTKEQSIDMKTNCPAEFIMRDGGIRIIFEILNAKTPGDWFGVYLRSGDIPYFASYLVYVRQSGHLEIAQYPGPPRVLRQLDTKKPISGVHELTIHFENNHLEAHLDEDSLETDNLSFQKAGRVVPAALNSNVTVHSFEMICRDTIAWE